MRSVRRSREAKFQLTFLGLHAYAALIAGVALSLHLGAVLYHTKRFMGAL